MDMTDKQKGFFSLLKERVADPKKVTDIEIKDVAAHTGVRAPWKCITPYTVEKDVFDCTVLFDEVAGIVSQYKAQPFAKAPAQKREKKIKNQVPVSEYVKTSVVDSLEKNVEEMISADYFVPVINETFVPFGSMSTTTKVIKSGKFCPMFIFGETGLGKSFSVSQIAARAKREVIRINVTAQTCEEDLIGGFRLIDGETVWQDGPLVIAMKRGAILLIDEVTALNPAYAFMLFTALEGEPIYVKKINKIVAPAPGFNIIATDNTRGYGTSSGRYVGVNVQNEAFLDRFTIAVEYNYPSPTQELKIISSFGTDTKIMQELIKWANFVRNTYNEGAIDVTISPRRLIKIMVINDIFCDLKQSIRHSIARFESDVVESLLDFFDKIVSDPNYSSDDFTLEFEE